MALYILGHCKQVAKALNTINVRLVMEFVDMNTKTKSNASCSVEAVIRHSGA